MGKLQLFGLVEVPLAVLPIGEGTWFEVRGPRTQRNGFGVPAIKQRAKKTPVIPVKEAGDFFAWWLSACGSRLILPVQTPGSRERFRSYSSMTFLV